MKPKKSNPTDGPSVQPIHLEFNHPTAKAVLIAGTFNGWRPDTTPMVAVGGGRWIKELVLAPGTYEYRLVVDGQWTNDPSARRTTPNPYGGQNSVLTVPDHETAGAVNRLARVAEKIGLTHPAARPA